MYSRKMVPVRGTWIFKVLLQIKESKRIDFDLGKHVLFFNINKFCSLFEKFQILKLRWAFWDANLAATS